MFVVVHVSGAVHITELKSEIDQVGEQAVNVGDRILSINGEDVAHWPISEVFTLLSKISLGAKVQLSLRRNIKENSNFALIQHTSSACRMARSEKGKNLASAKLLATISDSDMYRFRSNPGGYIYYSFILLAALVLVWTFEGLILDLFIEVIIPITWTGFMIANNFGVQKVGYQLLVGVYIVIGMFLLYYFKEDVNSGLWYLREKGQSRLVLSANDDRTSPDSRTFTVSITKTESGLGFGIAQHISTGIYMF